MFGAQFGANVTFIGDWDSNNINHSMCGPPSQIKAAVRLRVAPPPSCTSCRSETFLFPFHISSQMSAGGPTHALRTQVRGAAVVTTRHTCGAQQCGTTAGVRVRRGSRSTRKREFLPGGNTKRLGRSRHDPLGLGDGARTGPEPRPTSTLCSGDARGRSGTRLIGRLGRLWCPRDVIGH